MAKGFDPENYRLLLAPDNFHWRGEHAPGLPIICAQDGTVFEPFAMYFGWAFHNKRTAISSMKDEAHILREWLAYIDSCGRDWDDVNDQLMIDWREGMKEEQRKAAQKGLKPPISDARILRKVSVVFTFYDKIPEAMVSRDFNFVSKHGPITLRETVSAGRSRIRDVSRLFTREWACADRAGRRSPNPKRKTPFEAEVAKVLEHLRNTGAEELRDRNWLIGRTEAEAGLRREELSELTIAALERALRREGIKIPAPEMLGSSGVVRRYGLDVASSDRAVQKDILASLDRLERRRIAAILVTVIGKGNKERDVPFPVDLIRDLLAIGIWNCRRAQLDAAPRAHAKHVCPPAMFLSTKTGAGFTKDPLTKIVKKAFKECGIEGSGHRLRAYFATHYAERLCIERFTGNGFQWNQSIQNTVMDKLTEAMGHKSATTTVKYYLGLGLEKALAGAPGSQHADLRNLNDTVFEFRRPLGDTVRDLGELARRAAHHPSLRTILNMLAQDPDYALPTTTIGSGEPKAGGPRPSHPMLRLVPKIPDA